MKNFSKKLIALILIFSIFTPSFVEANREMRLFAGFKIKLLGTKIKLLAAAPVVSGGDGCGVPTDTGWVAAASGVDDAAIGTATWSNPGNIALDDGTRATAAGISSAVSHYLHAFNFNFSLPTSATVDGLEVRFQAHRTTTTFLSSVSIFDANGNPTGTAINPSVDLTATVDTVFQYGGSSDLWGFFPTDATVEDSDFGFGISATGAPNLTPNADFAEMKVYYTVPCSPPTVTSDDIGVFTCAPDVTILGTITDTGGANAHTRGFARCTNSACNVIGAATSTESGSFGTGQFNYIWTGRTAAVQYWYRAYAINSLGITSYGIIETFTASAC